MAILEQPWDKDRILGMKGILDFYFWKGIPVVRAWPQFNPQSLTANTKAQNPAFGYINQQWSQTSIEVQEAYSELAAGSQRLPRDYQLELYYGYDIELELA